MAHHQIEPYTRKTYAQGIVIVRENQRTPMHHHVRKAEDIICRGAGNPQSRVYNNGPVGKLAETPVEVSVKGVRHRVPPGHTFMLKSGESVTLRSFLYDEFWVQLDNGALLCTGCFVC